MDTESGPSIDEIVASVDQSTNSEIPMESSAPELSQAPAAPQTPNEYEIEYSGQKIKAPIEKVLKWASMGYGAPIKIGELQKRATDYEAKLKSYEPYDKIYKPIDEWAAKNPEKWQALFSQWQAAQYGGVPQPQNGQAPNAEQIRAQLPPELLQELQASREWRENQIQEKQVQRTQAADQGLDHEIMSIRKQYSNLDFDAPDETGNSLEYQILKHATHMGIPSFRAAFRDYCFDKLGKISESKGLERGSVPAKTKADLLGKAPASNTRGSRPAAEFVKTRNYDQIHEHVLQELGLTTG